MFRVKTPEHFLTIPMRNSALRVMVALIKLLGSMDLLYSMTTHPVNIILVVRHVYVTDGLKPSGFWDETAGRAAVLNA
jgi:hypothetical protein